MDHMNQNYMGQQQRHPQPYTQKTAINDLDAFLSGLTDDDRENIFMSPNFGPAYQDFLNKFLFYLLQGEIGAAYINSSPKRREMAEVLKLNASAIHAAKQNTTKSEVESLREANEKMLQRIADLEKGAGKK